MSNSNEYPASSFDEGEAVRVFVQDQACNLPKVERAIKKETVRNSLGEKKD